MELNEVCKPRAVAVGVFPVCPREGLAGGPGDTAGARAGDRAWSSWKVPRALFCGCDGEEGAWGGDTSPEMCPEGKDKSQIPLKQQYKQGCVTQIHREQKNPELVHFGG